MAALGDAFPRAVPSFAVCEGQELRMLGGVRCSILSRIDQLKRKQAEFAARQATSMRVGLFAP